MSRSRWTVPDAFALERGKHLLDDGEVHGVSIPAGVRHTASGGLWRCAAEFPREFYVAGTRKLATPLAAPEAEAATRGLAAYEVVAADAALVLRAIALARSKSLSLWDALIVESALASGCDRLLSEDLQDGQVFSGLVVENPFE